MYVLSEKQKQKVNREMHMSGGCTCICTFGNKVPASNEASVS